MKEILLSLITGVAVGVIFSLFKFPIPAPNNAAGIAGVVGIWLGLVVINFVWK